jgi:hypothetical protein
MKKLSYATWKTLVKEGEKEDQNRRKVCYLTQKTLQEVKTKWNCIIKVHKLAVT